VQCGLLPGVVDLLKQPPPRVCYLAELGRSTSKDVNINRGNPKIVERCMGLQPSGIGGTTDPYALTTCVTLPDMFVLR